ncbi:hypothetical protein I6A60_19030 [Frankia sp. AgB1.9]|uniref:hypothetical protein n=1 Tax=unclassified Frankia TaxID=2632575 RepID=UPI001933388F|nr:MULTISPECIES: hypothetical protein [unclassified Frankia]MBL7487890.1 hypothetical protein [Frankia sp. AgW1.1]MBL7549955.1 hypothetical protein [Frankia sp. AgB1.9]MBL7621466.1 hypothetical protein [Frankia sp. AgB1.8]
MDAHSGPVAGLETFVPRAPAVRNWQDEWKRWAAGPEAAAGLARWSTDPVLGPHTSSVGALLAASGRDLNVPAGDADAVLAELVSRARSGDFAAGRVALERLVPALTTQAWRRCRRGGSAFGDVFAELVGAAWIVIRCYSVKRRPAKVAVNLVYDTVGLVFGYVPVVERRTVLAGLTPHTASAETGDRERTAGGGLTELAADRASATGTPLPSGVDLTGPSPLAELFAVLLDGRAAGVPAERLRVLAELGVIGLSQREAAAKAGVSERAVRARRDAAVGALRAALLPAAVA